MSATVNTAHENQRFIFLSLPKLHELSHSRKSMVRMHFEGFRKWDASYFRCFPCISIQEPSLKLKFLARAASASSFPPLSGSGDEYSDQLLGAKTKKKTRRIAGVDQEEIEDPTLIADSDSCFCEFNGVQLHHKICDAELSAPDTLKNVSSLQSSNPTTKISFPMILLHGFGASLFSWNRVMKPLAQVRGSKVLSFDRPAFGLTSRVDASKNSSPGKEDNLALNPYSMMFSVLATLHFINVLAAEKVILVGHSAGSLVAVDTYFEAPERVAALILVAPAIIAPFFKQNDAKESQVVRENRIDGNSLNSNIPMNLFLRFCSILSNFTKYIAKAIVHVAKLMGDMINSLYKKALAAILRSTFGVMAIRMIIDKFGIPAIRAAWYDSNQVSDHVLQGYTKPLTVKGWDKALVEYTVAMLTDSASKPKVPLEKRLSQISCPVLIVTGDNDRLVPSWNSERLSRAIPGSYLEIIKNCGHLPQEEKAEEFVSIVDKFLLRVFGAAEEQCLQTVT